MLICSTCPEDEALRANTAVAKLYDAAIDGRLWSAALMNLVEAFGGFDGQLLLNERGAWSFLGIPLPSSMAGQHDYVVHWAARDVRRQLVDSVPIGRMVACHQHFDDRFVARSAFYQEFLMPGGWRYAAGGRVAVSDDSTAYVAIHRLPDQPAFVTEEIARLSEVAPHLGRAVRIRRKLAEAQSAEMTFRAVLDRVDTPSLILDSDRRLLFLNKAAEAIISMKDGIRVRDNLLFLTKLTSDSNLARLLGRVDKPDP